MACRVLRPGTTGADAPQDGRLPSPYYVRVYAADGSPTGSPYAAPLTAQSPPILPALRAGDRRSVTGQPFTVGSADDKGSWRVVAVPSRDGTGAIAIATSLSDVSHTVNHLTLLEVLIGAVALALMGAAGYLLIRRSLSPSSQSSTPRRRSRPAICHSEFPSCTRALR